METKDGIQLQEVPEGLHLEGKSRSFLNICSISVAGLEAEVYFMVEHCL